MNYLMARVGAIAVLLLGLAACSDGSGVSGATSLGASGSSTGSSGVVSGSPIGGSSGGTTNGQSSCPTGVSACSGAALGVSVGTIQLSRNGLQTIGFSTTDLLPTNNNTAEAFGLLPANEGFAELRVLHDTDANISAVDLLLSQLKLFWDGRTERPRIIENFGLKRGRVQLGDQGMSTLVALAPQGDAFWDNNASTFTGTQDRYANNHYFERAASACDVSDAACVTAANNGLRLVAGNWRTGSLKPNQISATRLHEDGATQGPDQIPFAGFKGYRDLWNWNYRYAHVAGWVTKDTINIQEWGGGREHNKERRGTIAFGQLTDPAALPSSGSATYRGYARGWYSPDGQTEVYPIAADLEVTVDFGAKQATLRLLNVRIDEVLPANMEPNVKLTVGSTNVLPFGTPTNTAIGGIAHGDAAGYAGLRFFGPIDGGTPPELAGSFSIKGLSGITAIGGFIARRVVQ
ncbi:MAG: hypothetical protein NTZ96_01785 [Burkholderiales bacterium]|nr:hypothetical protein [Burkholderiales bacterium]